jgi:hypothetical protein
MRALIRPLSKHPREPPEICALISRAQSRYNAAMDARWTPWALARLLPFPGDGPVELTLLATNASDDVDAEVARGVSLRLHERYDARGNIPRDDPSRFVDSLVGANGLAFATRVLVNVCNRAQQERPTNPGHRAPYELRRDGQPWARLRRHIFRAGVAAADRDAALDVARGARELGNDLRFAVAYAFCVDEWVAADLPRALKEGYGKLALLASLANGAQARHALAVLLGDHGYSPPYQLVEEAVAHIPNLIRRLDDADAGLVARAAGLAWNATTRKPWRAIVESMPA